MIELKNFHQLLQDGISKKPKDLIISDLKWKYLVRCVLRGENILMIGPTGCAKTMAAFSVAGVFSRHFSIFNCGGGQDARATLIGNTVYRKDTGTLFCKSPFVDAIQTENAIILLDELTRGNHDFWNILFPILDSTQRYLRLDEQEGSPVVKVANGVSFIATANVGNEYTATKVLDKAISGRFPIKIEMEYLTEEELKTLFGILFPKISADEKNLMHTLAAISESIRMEAYKEDANISTCLPPRSLVHMARLVLDGFTLLEIAEMAIYPEYPDDGGTDGERTYVKQILQSYFPSNASNPVRDPRRPNK